MENKRTPDWMWGSFPLLFLLNSAERSCQLSTVPCTERAQSHATNANKIIERTKKILQRCGLLFSLLEQRNKIQHQSVPLCHTNI
jgi:hypothetical protein